jgi:drug/metabolite transporter (DMT)-like permease
MTNLESEETRPPSAGETKQDLKAVAKKRPSIWNPFQGLKTEADALEAAKVGAVVTGIIAIEHVVFGLSIGTRSATVGNLIAIVLMAFLGWYIFKEQKVWASITVLVWVIVEIVAKIIFVLSPNAASRGQPGSLIINVIGLAGALLSVRGCLKLRKLEHAEKAKEFRELPKA